MGTLQLPHQITPGTNENAANVQANDEAVRDYFNNGNVGPSNLEIMPAARVYNTANITLATSTLTALTFDAERYDTASMHSTASNTSRLTAPVTGVYWITGHVRMPAAATGTRAAIIRLNGTTFIGRLDRPASASSAPYLVPSALYRLAASDYVELLGYQESGGNLDVVAEGNVSPEFSMTLVSRIT